MIHFCPFCQMDKFRRYFHGAINYEFQALLTETRLPSSTICRKWIAICFEHYNTLLKIGVAVRQNDVFKLTEAEKLSLQRNQIMITNRKMKNLGTLDHHIIATVNSLEADGVTFSAFDITKRLRKRINDGEASIIGRPYKSVPSGGTQISTQWVAHEEVRDRVHELFDQGLLPNLTRDNNGTYWEYSPIGSASSGGLPPGNAVSLPPPQTAGSIPIHMGITGVCPPMSHSSVQVPAPAPLPAVDPLEVLTKKSKPVLRLRLVANNKYIVLPNGKTAWSRRCDVTQSTNCVPVVCQALKDGKIEVVPV